MKLYIKTILTTIFSFLILLSTDAQENQGFKTTIDFTMESNGSTICEVTNKYTAAWWDYWTKAVGSNTSIINNEMRKLFPKYHLSDFSHKQNNEERSNTVRFRLDGMMNINKNGKWEADLGSKEPNITKVSNTEFLLIEGTQTLKIHLPAGTKNAKVEKDSFGKAMLTYSASTGGGMLGAILRYGGILIALAGVGLFIRNRMKPNIKVVVNTSQPQAAAQKETTPVANIPKEISSN